MWDEKQFFEDFVNESDKIKPDKEFVESLKKLDSKENLEEQKRKSSSQIIFRYAAIAAAIVVAIAAGIWIYAVNRPGNNGGEEITLPINAGQEETADKYTDSSDISLERVKELVKDDSIQIVDGDGNIISRETRSGLEDMLDRAVETDSVTGMFGDKTQYIIKGEEEIVIQIYFEQYILINETDVYCFE